MVSRLLVLALWVGGLPCSGREAVPPQPRVRCRASRYPVAVDCSWTLPPAPHSAAPTSFIATYRLGVAAHGESRPCLQPTPEAASCIIPDVQMFSMVPYILNITTLQPWPSSSFVPFVPEHIIKPDPPEGVRLSPLPGQRLWVQWEPPRSWPFPEIFALKYRIRYKHHRSPRFRQLHSQQLKGGNSPNVCQQQSRKTHVSTHARARHSAGPGRGVNRRCPGMDRAHSAQGGNQTQKAIQHVFIDSIYGKHPEQAHPGTGREFWLPGAGEEVERDSRWLRDFLLG
ncbi:interleukin-27 subunit beta isoform X3 [Mustela lutreola]|uniref:interleukin-27 subunit beta isoform X3 n=1 Tax=Mustela lutreola TaxID=9666 RepID=UPI002796EE61|nr:interleukin-27 subunit beta isoform X3 [Mustela lutreola]